MQQHPCAWRRGRLAAIRECDVSEERPPAKFLSREECAFCVSVGEHVCDDQGQPGMTATQCMQDASRGFPEQTAGEIFKPPPGPLTASRTTLSLRQLAILLWQHGARYSGGGRDMRSCLHAADVMRV
jgi:hypothetical protein